VRGPRSLELSGRLADGTILAWPLTGPYIAQARAGRTYRQHTYRAAGPCRRGKTTARCRRLGRTVRGRPARPVDRPTGHRRRPHPLRGPDRVAGRPRHRSRHTRVSRRDEPGPAGHGQPSAHRRRGRLPSMITRDAEPHAARLVSRPSSWSRVGTATEASLNASATTARSPYRGREPGPFGPKIFIRLTEWVSRPPAG
jgi:hypothetical protein